MLGTAIADTVGTAPSIVVTVSVISIGARTIAGSGRGSDGEHPLSRSVTTA